MGEAVEQELLKQGPERAFGNAQKSIVDGYLDTMLIAAVVVVPHPGVQFQILAKGDLILQVNCRQV